MKRVRGIEVAVFVALACSAAAAAEVGVVSHVKVLSDKIEDVSSVAAWQSSFLTGGMSDEEKGLAIWTSVVKFRHQEPPPQEFLRADGGCVHDPIKTFNVYGYGMCCCASSNIESLGRAAGLDARGRIITAHSVPELHWGGDWHLLDASLICYFRDGGGEVASVNEIIGGVTAWYAANPGYQGDGTALYNDFMQSHNWYDNGPVILATSPHYDYNGWLPAATHGWYSTMAEYDHALDEAYEYGYSQGYEVNVRLREGETLARKWSNIGLHVNMDGSGGTPGCLTTVVGQGDLGYADDYGDLAPGRIGNGERVWQVPLGNGRYRHGALSVTNLVDAPEGPSVDSAAAPGVLVIGMPSSYVYLTGTLGVVASVGTGGSVVVSLSRNNGLSWTPVHTANTSSSFDIDVGPHVYRLYDYRLKFELNGAGTILRAARIHHDVQHSQRPLPALGVGANTIAFSADAASQGTVTLEANTTTTVQGNQRGVAEYQPTFTGTECKAYGLGMVAAGWPYVGSVTFPVATPGDMVRIRMGVHYRARDAADGWDFDVSFDNGASWDPAGRAAGPTPASLGSGSCEYVTYSAVPASTRSALVRFSGTDRNATVIFGLRIDADYVEPAGGFRPVRVTYDWEEIGVPQQDVHVANAASDGYTITCASAPVMKSITLALEPLGGGAGYDTDGDGTDDDIDDDDDGDGVLDADEVGASIPSDPLQPDSDGDGWTDGEEIAAGTDPNDGAAHPSFPQPPVDPTDPAVSDGGGGLSCGASGGPGPMPAVFALVVVLALLAAVRPEPGRRRDRR